MKDLAELVATLPCLEQGGDLNRPVVSLAYDSRRVEPGSLFVAIPGLSTDGHLYLEEAAQRGAVAVVIQRQVAVPAGLSWVRVPDSRRALAAVAAAFYGWPSRALRVIGVTGTNGKTTTTHLLEGVFNHAGRATGLVGTIANRVGGRSLPAGRTTPEASDLQRLLAEMVDQGAEYAVMEVSSHALELGRVSECEFDAAVFTNLTQDHLDFHDNLESYLRAKTLLFEGLDRGLKGGSCYAVLNADDPWHSYIKERTRVPVLTYGTGPAAAVRAQRVAVTLAGTSFEALTPWGDFRVQLRLVGGFNVANALAALTVALQEGLAPERVVAGLAAVQGVPGRFEVVSEGQDFLVVVDYAHTPDGLVNALGAARHLAGKRLITVFGCGGDRDRTKRPLMGEAAGRASDFCLVTSDNPRGEDPQAIVDDILPGLERVGASYRVVLDRRQAINEAVAMATGGDVIFIAGKGHETYQQLADRSIPFDDRQVARQALRAVAPCGS